MTFSDTVLPEVLRVIDILELQLYTVRYLKVTHRASIQVGHISSLTLISL